MMNDLRRAARAARFRSRRLRQPLVRWKHRDLNEEDVFVASYPRSGITWLRFMLFEIITAGEAEFGVVPTIVPYVGRHSRASPSIGNMGRLIFTHEPYSVSDRKVIYVVRDARSVAASEYRWQQRKEISPPTMDEFIARFVTGRSNPWGSWNDHVQRWLDSSAARNGRLHLIKFEDLRAETTRALKEASDFLGLEPSDSLVELAIANNSIDRMRHKEDSGLAPGRSRRDIRFIGTGQVSGWKQDLTADQVRVIQDRFHDGLSRLGYL